MAKRLCRLQPDDSRAARLLGDLARRLKTPSKDKRFPPPCGKMPGKTQIDCPVRWWRGVQRTEIVDKNDLASNSADRFLVAYGLALHGIGESRLKTTLLPRDDSSWLRRWIAPRNAQPQAAVWGIDLGTSGLKAVLLEQGRAQRPPRWVRSVYVPHGRPLNTSENDEQTTEILRQTIVQFAQQSRLKNAYAVLGSPGERSLSRHFDIPRLKPGKLADAMAYEVRMQIPVPSEEVVYDWHVWPDPETESRMQSVSLLAARRDHIRDLLSCLDDTPIAPRSAKLPG
jgi:hypothetical protein